MDKMPLAALVFQSVPESVILFALGLTLIGLPLRWKRIIPAAVILSLITFFVRTLPLPYGIHTIAGLLIMCTLLIVFFRASLQVAAAATLLTIIIYAVLEILLYPFVFLTTGLPVKQIWTDPVLRILIPLPELIALSIITWWCAKKKITLSTSWPFQQKEQEKNKHGGHEK